MNKHPEFHGFRAALGNPQWEPFDRPTRVQRAIRQMITTGNLPPGYRLPATRALAKAVGMARETVELAYGQLQAEGYVERKTGSGSFVSQKADFSLLTEKEPSSRTTIKVPAISLSQRASASIEKGALRTSNQACAFVTGIPETRTFPIAIWDRLQRQTVKDYRSDILLPGEAQGAEPLRRVIADYLNLRRGTHVTADQVLVLSSAQHALTLCAHVLADAGDGIYVENPAYMGARRAFEAAQLKLLPVPVDQDGLQVETLLAAKPRAKVIYVTPSHQYPTGASLALHRRLSLINWAADNGNWIIEDDYDSEFHYEGQPTASVHGLDRNGRTLYVGTFSKSLFPSLRLAYLVLPPALVAPMTIARSLFDGHCPTITQLTLARFMESGHFSTHVRAMRKLYAERRSVMSSSLKKHLNTVVDIQFPPGGLQLPCFIKEGSGISEERSIEAALRQNIILSAISKFYISGPRREGWLLGFSALNPAEIKSAVRRLKSALNV